MAGNPLCLLTLLRDYPLLCRLLPKTWSLKHYLGTLKPLPLFVYWFLILYFSLSASALLAPRLSYVALSLNNDYVEIAISVEVTQHKLFVTTRLIGLMNEHRSTT